MSAAGNMLSTTCESRSLKLGRVFELADGRPAGSLLCHVGVFTPRSSARGTDQGPPMPAC